MFGDPKPADGALDVADELTELGSRDRDADELIGPDEYELEIARENVVLAHDRVEMMLGIEELPG